MWTREIMDSSLLVLIECFIAYSIIGWFVESLYMSICNKKLTNRGFGVGPFCPIYGFGAIMGYYLLLPFKNNMITLYFVAAISATIFEYLVARLMLRCLNEVWWDYTMKPFNYQGVICLESTVAWGFYGIIIVYWLHGLILRLVTSIPTHIGRPVSMTILCLYLFDFMYHVLDALDINLRANIKEKREQVMDYYHSFRDR